MKINRILLCRLNPIKILTILKQLTTTLILKVIKKERKAESFLEKCWLASHLVNQIF